VPTIDELLHGVALRSHGPSGFVVNPLQYYGDGGGAARSAVSRVVFGGQLLAQAIAIAGHAAEGQFVRSVSIDFVRVAVVDHELTAGVDIVKRGASVSNIRVTFSQAGKVCALASVLCVADFDDQLALGQRPPVAGGPGDHGAVISVFRGYERAFLDGDGVWDGSVGPPATVLWVRFPGGPHTGTTGQGLLSLVTVPFLVDVALRPFDGLSAARAHTSLSTAVLSHGITFHHPVDAAGWHLVDLHATAVAGGGGYGRGAVFDGRGTLVASFHQDMMIRTLGGDAGSDREGTQL